MPEGIGIQFRGAPTGVAFRGLGAGRVFEYLLRVLDGTRDLKALSMECPDDIPRDKLLKTISLLHSKGLLAEGDFDSPGSSSQCDFSNDEILRRQLLFWGRKLGLTGYLCCAEEVQDKLAHARIAIVGSGLFGISTYDLLARSGCGDLLVIDWDDNGFLINSIRAGPSPPRSAVHLKTTSVDAPAEFLRDWASDADLVVTATRNAPALLFRAINRICLDCKCQVLFANDDGTEVELGPYVIPYAAACYCCVQLRKASAVENMLEEQVYQRQLAAHRDAGKTLPLGESIVSATLAASLVAIEVVRVVTGTALPTLLNAVMTLSPLVGKIETHQILRVPRCPECSRGSTLPTASNAHA